MRWSLVALLSALGLVSLTKSSPLSGVGVAIDHAVDTGKSTKPLLRRATKISDLFSVDSSTCGGKEAILDTWLEEAVELHKSVKFMYENTDENDPILALWLIFFGIEFDRETKKVDMDDDVTELVWPIVGDHINRVTQFLIGGGLSDPVTAGKPHLFCSGDAAEYQDWGQIVKDKDAKPVVLKTDPDTDLPTDYLTLNDAFPLGSDVRRDGGNVFWMPAYNGYDFIFNGYKEACPPSFINERGNWVEHYGRTSRAWPKYQQYYNNDGPEVEFGRSNRHILLCPPTFSPRQGSSHSYPSLAEAVSVENYPSPGQDPAKGLDRLMTVSSTFYHELYHLTDDDNTRDQSYKLNDILTNARNLGTVTGNAHNPETYAFFAMASYILLNAPEDSGKDPVLYCGSFPVDADGPYPNV